jgi:cytochrome o ubiquinol oxidase subunit 2
VVSLDWKWLFIYPDQNIASVNRLIVPAGTPISFDLTSSGVMNSFFVPQLGSQIYTMAGMATELNLLADHPGDYGGMSAQFSGDGFSDMRFTVTAMPQAQFNAWVGTAHGSPPLDAITYAALAADHTSTNAMTFGSVIANLFHDILVMRPIAAAPARDGKGS